MSTTTAAPQDTVRQSAQGQTGSKGNLFVAAVLLLVLAFLTGLTPANARAATWDVLQAVVKLDGSGLSKTIAKAGDKAKQNAQSNGLINPSLEQISQRGQALVASGGVTTTTEAKCDPLNDLKSGKMFPQDVTYLEKLVKAGFKVRVNCIFTGHSPNVQNTDRTSLHNVWKGFDIDWINGQPVCDNLIGEGDSRVCTRPSSASKQLIRWLLAQNNSQLPFEVGGPFQSGSRDKNVGPSGSRGGPFFTNPGHQGHFHFGFKPTNPNLPAGTWWAGA